MRDTRTPGIATAVSLIIGTCGIAAMSVVFAISFTAIIYTGPLAPYLSQGIALTLIGGTLTAVVGGFAFSYRGNIAQPQDVTAILLGLAAASIGAGGLAGEALFATVATMVLIASFLTGLAAYAFGRFRLGILGRFIPFPVLAGFLAATGYLLTIGAIGMILGHGIDLYALPGLLAADVWPHWGPWLAASLGLVVLTRAVPNPLTLPVLLLMLTAGFYAFLALTGRSLEDAAAAGWLLGPFGTESFLAGIDPSFPLQASAPAIIAQAPTLIAVVGMALLGALLNASGLSLALRRDVDLDQDLKAVGLANLAASAGGGLVAYHLLGETIFAARMGLTGRLAPMAAGAGTLLALLFGAQALSVLPVGLFASVIAYLGIDLLVTWLWERRRDLPALDYGLVLLILAAAAAIGFLQALTIGLLAAAGLFIYSYAQIDTIRLSTSLAQRRSDVERGPIAAEVLAAQGETTQIYELAGYLFFGTASRLQDRVQEQVSAGGALTRLILDFRQVPNLDASAAFVLSEIATRCRDADVELWCSGVREGRQTRFPTAALTAAGVILYDRLPDALEAAEDVLLATAEPEDDGNSFLAELARTHPDLDPYTAFDILDLAPGDLLMNEGDGSQDMYVLLRGSLAAEVADGTGGALRVARFRPGALVGEIATYAGVPRTAAVRATTATRVLRLPADGCEKASPETDRLAAALHRIAAGVLARRVVRMNRLLRDLER